MRHALRTIRSRMRQGAYAVTTHFADEMRNDRLFWPDILAAIDGARRCIDDGCDAEGDPKYRLGGHSLDGRAIEIVCVVKDLVILVTVYALRSRK